MSAKVTIRDLRNKGGQVLRRVARGESLTVTSDGVPIAQLRPVQRTGISAAVLLERWAKLPHVDPNRLRRDLDRVLDASL